MNNEIIELTPESKKMFDLICDSNRLDKQTRIRAIYLYEEFMKSQKGACLKGAAEDSSLFLKIAVFISSKNGKVTTAEGFEMRDPGIRMTSFIRTLGIQLTQKNRKIR